MQTRWVVFPSSKTLFWVLCLTAKAPSTIPSCLISLLGSCAFNAVSNFVKVILERSCVFQGSYGIHIFQHCNMNFIFKYSVKHSYLVTMTRSWFEYSLMVSDSFIFWNLKWRISLIKFNTSCLTCFLSCVFLLLIIPKFSFAELRAIILGKIVADTNK